MRKIALFILNNILVNQFLIVFKKDHTIKKYKANWSRVTYDHKKSLQENVGFSHEPNIEHAIKIVHEKLQAVALEYNATTVLDIGCGTGLYLSDFKPDTILYGTDLSAAFIEEAQRLVPQGHFIVGDFMKLNLSFKFDLIFSISVIEYIPPSQLLDFFKKAYANLNPGGILFIQYPQALSYYQTLYPDLSYVQYAPKHLEKTASGIFKIIRHSHAYDDRPLLKKYDRMRYDSEKEKSFRNGAILIVQKAT